jgi:DNA-binding Lrp family transcriptional regulator
MVIVALRQILYKDWVGAIPEGIAMRAYVFVNATAGKTRDVVGELRSIQGVKSADLCWGLPDLVAAVEAADLKELGEVVLNRIQKVAGVTQSDTHIVIES